MRPVPSRASRECRLSQSRERRYKATPRIRFELATRAGMTQPALSRLEAGGVIPTIPLLDRISAALDADLIVEIAPHAA
ncbi:MAG TPA: helix-turn-helix transcriptional regulator [Streptosporangiaceae bacterium]|nr:helix-turn-helix transcriptional regulator [Streptosporangiaceae bacterium]